MNQRVKNKKNKKSVGFNGMLRDVGLAAINRGQGPIVLFLLFLIIWASRAPNESLGTVGEGVIEVFKSWWYVGWVVTIILAAGWWSHAKSVRRIHHQEMDRIGKEKSALQKAITDRGNKNHIKSSDKA